MTGQAGLGFGGLLRRLRDEAGLTQEELAEAAAIARDIGVPLDEARALEGIGQSHLCDGNTAEAASTCDRHSRSTSASEASRSSESRKHCVTTS